MASKTRSSSGKTHWSKLSSSEGTLSILHDLYAMATHRRLLAAISSIANLKKSCKEFKKPNHLPKAYFKSFKQSENHDIVIIMIYVSVYTDSQKKLY